ncbi:sigma 54-interacting transcriptional regulator [Roseibium salinum]|nr:sigma 54-interacting transcriptional regulator [Roseibium salinum]
MSGAPLPGRPTTGPGPREQADRGTLFLDEIGEMDLLLQSKLLRFLQTGTFQRLGDTQTRKVNARIICATNRNPVAEISAGRFREDLYYRLHVLPVHLPPRYANAATIFCRSPRLSWSATPTRSGAASGGLTRTRNPGSFPMLGRATSGSLKTPSGRSSS